MQLAKLNKSRRNKLIIASLLLLNIGNNSMGTARGNEKPSIVYWAELLIQHITDNNTGYRHKETLVNWDDSTNVDHYQSYTDCSGLIYSLLKQTFKLNDQFFKTWLGKSRPLAYNYFDAIVAGNHFIKIDKINNVHPGDLLVVKYVDRSEHEDNTGHCMLVISVPHQCNPTELLEPGTTQYEIAVIDASKKPHGKSDSRYTATKNYYAGTGKGLFRLYVNNRGNIAGYSWSTSKPKPDFNPFTNPVIVGRIDL